MSQNSQKNTCARVSFIIKLQTEACSFIKKDTFAQVLSCELNKFPRTPFLTTTPGAASISRIFEIEK